MPLQTGISVKVRTTVDTDTPLILVVDIADMTDKVVLPQIELAAVWTLRKECILIITERCTDVAQS